ncbi:MAG: hypothetical protein HY708_08440 [Ignavibacteriae bacterium]|nr:hypothetical protein [Ignavibacteriota bacterium]
MHGMIDYLGSLIISGMVFLVLMGFYLTMGETAATQTFNSGIQEDLTSTTEILEYDLRKIGYRVSDSVKVTFAGPDKIVFRTDIDNNGSVDSIQFSMVTAMGPSGGSNPYVVNRTVNGVTAKLTRMRVTNLNFTYYNAQGAVTSVLKDIISVKVSLAMENTVAYDGNFPKAYWERVIKPQNLR